MYDWFLIETPVLRKWELGFRGPPSQVNNIVKIAIMIFLLISLYTSMLLYYDYIRLVLCLVIVSCSPCPCNSEVHSQNEAIALKYLENLTFTKSFL